MSTDRFAGPETLQESGGLTGLTYQHANPENGNESVLLRFEYEGCSGDACLLVDAGKDVSLERLLDPDDWLAGICLTHAHLDHYHSLPNCIEEGSPVFAAPGTAAILNEALNVADERHGLASSVAVTDSVVVADGWMDVCPGVKVHALPAGHAPGAAGFLVRFDDGQTHDILLTGDFTLEDCAGYPGFDLDLASNVDVVFLTGSTGGSFGEVLLVKWRSVGVHRLEVAVTAPDAVETRPRLDGVVPAAWTGRVLPESLESPLDACIERLGVDLDDAQLDQLSKHRAERRLSRRHTPRL